MERQGAVTAAQPEPAVQGEWCVAGCGSRLRRAFWLKRNSVLRCPICGLYALVPETHVADPALDRAQLEPALRHLRRANYMHVLRRLGELMPLAGRKLLDVGCSSGWFLDLAQASGCACYGIEPDEFFYQRAATNVGAFSQLAHGFFARDLPPAWGLFDIITFHDVFEHFDEPMAILHAARERLGPGGHLVFSLPMADGFAFRLAQLLYRLGTAGPLERMFQIHYPYPHLFYFTRHNFASLARHAGLQPILVERLRSFSVRGALHRAGMDRTVRPVDRVKRYAAAAGLTVLALMERLLPADNVLIILRAQA